jgi:SAM-dependent methyltransferase
MCRFKDGTFDIYYSGGVVEHFEGGCSEALQEARRVLQPNGKLLISVPYYSPLRRILYYRRKNWRRVGGPSLDNTNNDSLVFFQYAYTISEFKKQLSSAGLNVLAVQGYSLLWGLRDLNWVNKAMCLLENRSKGNSISKEEMIKDSPSINGDHKPSLLKRFLLSESPNTSLGKFCLRGMLLLCANMMMFICVPAKNE